MAIRVAIVEDDGRYRESVEILLAHTSGFALGGSFSSAEPFLAHVRSEPSSLDSWDVVLMDLKLPGQGGIEATRQLKAMRPGLPVMVLTVFEEPAQILEAICAGANGYVLKKVPAAELLEQLRSVVAGGAPLTAGVAKTVLQLLRQGGASRKKPKAALDLTNREQEVLTCLVEGLSYKQVAAELTISIDTVRSHIRSLYGKLQVHSVAEAVSRALRERLV